MERRCQLVDRRDTAAAADVDNCNTEDRPDANCRRRSWRGDSEDMLVHHAGICYSG